MMLPSSRKVFSLAATVALLLAVSSSRATAQETVTIVVPHDNVSPVLYSSDAAPEEVIALDAASAPQAVSMLLSSPTLSSPAATEEIEAPAAAPVSFAVASAEDVVDVNASTEEEAAFEATISMLQAALGGEEGGEEMMMVATETASSSSSDIANNNNNSNNNNNNNNNAALAVAGQPAPPNAASAPSPSAVDVAPTAQLVCPPTCPAGTRCRQGGRGTCEPFSAFDCSGGKCAPSPSSGSSTPTAAPTTPPVCKAKCTDVPPTPNWSCAQQMSFGACEQGWMAQGNYCQITCGRCPAECYDCGSMCLDKAPDRNGCAAQAGWGKCGETWMAGCMRSCGKCPAKCYSKAASSDGVEPGGAEFVSFVSVSSSTRLPRKAAATKAAPAPSPYFELGPVSAPFGALSEVAAGPEGAPEVRGASPTTTMMTSSSSPPLSSSSDAEAEAAAAAASSSSEEEDDVASAIERMIMSAEGDTASESAFEA